MSTVKVVQVCNDDDCDKKPVLNVRVGFHKHNFCCQKGLEKSLDDFRKSVKSKMRM